MSRGSTSPAAIQEELTFEAARKEREERTQLAAEAERMVAMLEGKGWMLSDALLKEMGEPQTEARRRWLRRCAAASDGRIAGGQEGYKLVREMTAEEFNHFRNAMKSQADEMLARVMASDRVFYARKAI